ncbi:MAG: type IV pilus assembly protein PilM [Fimbriimonas sp.]
MAKKLSSILGIDIGSKKIKVCEIRTQGREPVVTALGMIDTPEGAVDHTGVYNSDAVAVALKQVLNDAGASIPYAVVSIAGQSSVLVRILEVPKMNPAELKDHMQWEINRNIPFAESTVVSDFKPLPSDDPNSANMDVVMAIAPQSAIDTMVACIKRAGKTLAAIDVEPMSIARSIQTSYDDVLQSKTVCVVDVGHKTTSINIFKGSKLVMPRQVPIGGEMFTKAISDELHLSISDSENLKLTKGEVPESAADAGSAPTPSFGATQEFQPYNPFSDDPVPAPAAFDEPAPTAVAVGLDDPESARVYGAIASLLDEFVAEIRRSIDYFRSRGGEVDKIVLCGGGTKLKGLASFLGKSLAIECDDYDPFRRLNINARKVAPGFVEEHRQEFAVAVGNGLHILFD